MSFIIILFSTLICWVSLRSFIPQLSRQLIDLPNERSSHLLPTPRGGGVVFVFITVLASILLLFSGKSSPIIFLPLIISPLALISFIDDKFSLPASWRFIVQLLSASLILFASTLVSEFFVSLPLIFSITIFLFALIAVTAVVNFVNFCDGLDGLVAGCMLVIFSTSVISLSVPLNILALVGSLLGFLLWNWNPAKVFMGDVGSTFLGAMFVGLVLQSPSWGEVFGMLLVATPLLADACLCVLRRFYFKQPIFKAHRLHLFQRLHQAGWSHSRVSTLYISATILLALAFLFGGLPFVSLLASAVIIIGIWLDQRIALPFAMASLR